MMKAKLGQLVLYCLLLYTCAQVDYMYDNMDDTVHNLNSECNGTISERVGSIEISYNEMFKELSHFCALYVENATRFHLMLFQKPTELSESFYNVSGLINVIVYDHDPNSGGLPVDELKDEEVSQVVVVPGNRVWLSISMNIDDLGSASTDFDDIHWYLAYVAVIDDFLPSCDPSGIEETENGVYRIRNDTFGSVADLECSEGFVLDNVSRFAMCSVVDNVLRWIPGTAVCSSVCEHPPTVLHANMNPRMDTTFGVDNSRTDGSTGYFTDSTSYTGDLRGGQQGENASMASGAPTTAYVQSESSIDTPIGNPTTTHDPETNDAAREPGTTRSNDTSAIPNTSGTGERPTRNETLRTNVTVFYTCNPPYILTGLDTIHCGLDSRGVQRWFDLPPSCFIPDCSQTIIFREHSGSIVNPSYPGTTLKGGSQICTWQINAPDDTFILFNTVYVNLPDVPDVVVSVLDTGPARPAPLLQLTNHSLPQNVTSQTSRVTVTYHGPPQDMAGYRGFYIQYVMQGPDALSKALDTSVPTLKEQTDYSAEFSERSTSNTTQPTINQTTQPIITQIEEQSITPTSVQPTNQEHEGNTSEDSINHITQQNTNQSTEDFTSSSWKPPTELTNRSFPNITTSPVHVSSANVTLPFTDDFDDSGDIWKIIIGVMIPLCVLVLVLVCLFVCFRRKYPVRMMIGRDVTKVCNPQYGQPVDCPALVRENASQFFSKRQSAISEENISEKNCVVYENLGFSRDDSDEEQEHKFMETKKWLFGETAKSFETSSTSAPESYSESDIPGMDPLQLKSEYELQKAEMDAKDASGARLMMPSLQRKHNKEPEVAETKTQDSKSGLILSPHENQRNDERFHFGGPSLDDAETVSVSVSDEDSGRSSPSSYRSESIDIHSEIRPNKRDQEDEEEEESGFMKSSMILFQQPTFEEVWARVKARSKSLNCDRPLVEIKQRSFTVDPGKSARKMSLHDDVTASELFKSLSSSSRSDQQPEASFSLNLNNTSTTSTSFAPQVSDSSLESSHQKETEVHQPVDTVSSREDGGSVRSDEESCPHNNHGQHETNEPCLRLPHGVYETDYTDNMTDARVNNFDTSTALEISKDDPAISGANVGFINSRKLSNSTSFNSETASSLDTPGLSHEEPTCLEESPSCYSNEDQTQRLESSETKELPSFAGNQLDNTNITSEPSIRRASLPITSDANDSDASATRSHPDLLNRTNPENHSSETDTTLPKSEAGGQEVAASNSIIGNNVDDINNDINDDITQNLNDGSDDESTGVKVTDSDISDILNRSSSDETEPADSDDELSDDLAEKVISNNTQTSVTLRQDSDSNDIDV